MPRKMLLAGAVATAICQCFGQTAQQPSPNPATPVYPDSTYFKFFFIHVARLQNAADALKAQGKKDMPTRNLIKNHGLLTNQEFAVVVSVASSCNTAWAAESKSGMAVARQLGKPYPNASLVPPTVVQQISDLEAQRTLVISNCMASLQSQMGPLRYQVLRDFVVASEAPNIQHIARTAPAPPAKKPVPPAN